MNYFKFHRVSFFGWRPPNTWRFVVKRSPWNLALGNKLMATPLIQRVFYRTVNEIYLSRKASFTFTYQNRSRCVLCSCLSRKLHALEWSSDCSWIFCYSSAVILMWCILIADLKPRWRAASLRCILCNIGNMAYTSRFWILLVYWMWRHVLECIFFSTVLCTREK